MGPLAFLSAWGGLRGVTVLLHIICIYGLLAMLFIALMLQHAYVKQRRENYASGEVNERGRR